MLQPFGQALVHPLMTEKEKIETRIFSMLQSLGSLLVNERYIPTNLNLRDFADALAIQICTQEITDQQIIAADTANTVLSLRSILLGGVKGIISETCVMLVLITYGKLQLA